MCKSVNCDTTLYFNDWNPDTKSNDRVFHARFDSLDIGRRTMQISSLMRVIVTTLLLAAARSVAGRIDGNVPELKKPSISQNTIEGRSVKGNGKGPPFISGARHSGGPPFRGCPIQGVFFICRCARQGLSLIHI